jgi:6-phospho-beta-glucosidase
MKLTVVGGGSTYTPELIDGFARLRDVLPVDEVWLVDPDAHRLELVSAISRRMFAREGHPGKIVTTSDLVAGVADADVVLIQLRIGGQAARKGDETWPHACGCIGQETTGPGGFAKALRTVPVVLQVAEAIRKHAKPDAWIIDFTNPVGIVTRALLQAGHHAIGLCNVAIGFQRKFATMLGVDHSHVQLQHVGLNHLTWERGVTVDGRQVLPEMLEAHLGELAEEVELPTSLVAMLGMVPSYYLRYFYAHDKVLGEQLEGTPRATDVLEIERQLLELYRDPTLAEKPLLLEQRGGAFYSEAAIGLASSLATGDGAVHVVDVRNAGTLAGLADDDVVEVPARIDREGATPLAQTPLAPELLGLVQHVAAYERLTAQAAVTGDAVLARKALLTHPLIGQYAIAEELLERLLEAGVERMRGAAA